MSQNKWFRRAAGAALVCASVATISPLSSSTVPAVSAQAPADPGGEFHALTPTRIFDSRPEYSLNDVAPIGAKPQVTNAAGSTAGEFHFNPLGQGGLPADPNDVLAVVAMFTVTEPGSSGYMAVYPRGFEFGGADGSDQISALINIVPGDNVPNLGIVGLDDTGFMTINAAGANASTYHLVIDVFGFISTSQYDGASTGARLEAIDPGRILDTRDNNSPIGPGESRRLQVRGADTIPDAESSPIRTSIVPDRSTVSAVLVNLALVNMNPTSQITFLTATPDAIDPTDTITASSNVNPGRVRANMAVVPIGADGSIQLYNNRGDLHLVVDVLGYFEQGVYSDSNFGRIVPLEAPFRSFDTRDAEFGDAPLQHGSQEEWSFQNFVQSVTLNPPEPGDPCVSPCVQGPPQQALLGNLVATQLQPLYPSHAGLPYWSYLKLSPANAEPALTANVNFSLSEDVGNMSLVKYGTSGDDDYVVEAYNDYGKIDYVLDVYAIVLGD